MAIETRHTTPETYGLASMYEFIRGPLAWFAFLVFLAGSAYQVGRFFRLTRLRMKGPGSKPRISAPEKASMGRRPFTSSVARLLARLRVSVWGWSPVTLAVSTVFHVLLFLVPVFLLVHNSLFMELWGVSLCPHVLSDFAADALTLSVFACGVFFLGRRIFLARVRAISDAGDYLVLLITLAPFLTGFLAVKNVFDYRMMVIMHILSVEILWMALPFTRLNHMILFFLNRFLIGHEYGLGRGLRRW